MLEHVKRTWKPTGTTVRATAVKEWTWTRREGLMVETIDGTRLRSAWGTLREFLKAVKEGRERATEITP